MSGLACEVYFRLNGEEAHYSRAILYILKRSLRTNQMIDVRVLPRAGERSISGSLPGVTSNVEGRMVLGGRLCQFDWNYYLQRVAIYWARMELLGRAINCGCTFLKRSFFFFEIGKGYNYQWLKPITHLRSECSGTWLLQIKLTNAYTFSSFRMYCCKNCIRDFPTIFS